MVPLTPVLLSGSLSAGLDGAGSGEQKADFLLNRLRESALDSLCLTLAQEKHSHRLLEVLTSDMLHCQGLKEIAVACDLADYRGQGECASVNVCLPLRNGWDWHCCDQLPHSCHF